MNLANRDFRKIGLWQTAFLGDAVLTLPLLQALRLRYPEAEIHFFVRAGLEKLFHAQRELTSVRPFAKRGDQKGLLAARALGRELSLEGFDLWISPHASLRSAYMARCVGAPVRIGYNAPWYNWLAYTHLVDRRFDQLEEIERIFQLGGPLGIFADKNTPAPLPRLDLPPEATARAEEIFSGLPKGPKLGIHPGSTWPTKCWPKDYFADIARRALAAGAVVLLFAGPGEEALAAHIASTATTSNAPARIHLLTDILRTSQKNKSHQQVVPYPKELEDCQGSNRRNGKRKYEPSEDHHLFRTVEKCRFKDFPWDSAYIVVQEIDR